MSDNFVGAKIYLVSGVNSSFLRGLSAVKWTLRAAKSDRLPSAVKIKSLNYFIYSNSK